MNEKSQDIRLLDIFIIGPFLLWLSLHPEQEPKWLKPWILLLGAGTIAYNAATYFKQKEKING